MLARALAETSPVGRLLPPTVADGGEFDGRLLTVAEGGVTFVGLVEPNIGLLGFSSAGLLGFVDPNMGLSPLGAPASDGRLEVDPPELEPNIELPEDGFLDEDPPLEDDDDDPGFLDVLSAKVVADVQIAQMRNSGHATDHHANENLVFMRHSIEKKGGNWQLLIYLIITLPTRGT